MSKKDLSLQKYGISKRRYRELHNHCLQYEEFKKNENTKHFAIRIEETAREADASLQEYILKSVTQDIPFRYMNVPAGINQFYAARRNFYIMLSQKMIK